MGWGDIEAMCSLLYIFSFGILHFCLLPSPYITHHTHTHVHIHTHTHTHTHIYIYIYYIISVCAVDVRIVC